MVPKVAIIIYSMYSFSCIADGRYGHIKKMADAEAEGLKAAGLECDMFQYVSPSLITQGPRDAF